MILIYIYMSFIKSQNQEEQGERGRRNAGEGKKKGGREEEREERALIAFIASLKLCERSPCFPLKSPP